MGSAATFMAHFRAAKKIPVLSLAGSERFRIWRGGKADRRQR
jgi:hypothetical protein